MINYTDLSVMKSSDVVKLAETTSMYKEEPVEESNFETKKQYLYKGYEVPKDVQMLKFRYYTPENTLIEQNNVPYVYDGTSITDVINYYYLSDSNTAPTFNYSTWETDGWTKKAQTVTAKQRYLWCITETRFSNTTEGQCGNLTEVVLVSIYGEQGERGAMYLGHYADNQACYTANTPSIFIGDFFLDTTDHVIKVYKDEDGGDSTTWESITDYTDYHYSLAINDIFSAVSDIANSSDYHAFFAAQTAWIKNLAASVAQVGMLFSNTITLTQGQAIDKNGDIYYDGGVIKSSNYSSGSSGWQIRYDGNAEFNSVTVRGNIQSSTITCGSESSGTYFNVTTDGSVTMYNATVQGKLRLKIYTATEGEPTDLAEGDMYMYDAEA